MKFATVLAAAVGLVSSTPIKRADYTVVSLKAVSNCKDINDLYVQKFDGAGTYQYADIGEDPQLFYKSLEGGVYYKNNGTYFPLYIYNNFVVSSDQTPDEILQVNEKGYLTFKGSQDGFSVCNDGVEDDQSLSNYYEQTTPSYCIGAKISVDEV